MLAHYFPRTWVFAFLFALSLFIIPLTTFAQGSTGIGIKPATIEETVDPGRTQTYTVEFTNLTPNQQVFYLFTRDIVGVADGGTPIFAEENQEKTGFEITEWISLPVAELDMAAGETKAVEVTINVPENATPGSHFGAIFATLTPPRMRQSGASIGYEVANIISLRVAGDAVESAQIRSFSTDNYIHGSLDVGFRARIENKGTVLVRPTGPLEVYNMFGKRVALLTFNESKAGIFPFTTREFTLEWDDEGPGFGRYQAILSLVHGDQGRKTTISSTLSFWILPMNIIGPALGILAVLLLTTYIGIKLYIRRSMAYVTGGTRLVRRRRGGGVSTLVTIAVVMLGVTALFLIILLALFA